MLAAAALALALQSTPVDPASADAAAVMVPVNGVFAALSARDGQALLPLMDAEARINVVAEGPNGARRHASPTVADFTGSLTPGPERFEEIMPAPSVMIDGDIASVWGRYVFRVDGELSHCGVNHFGLIRRDGVWKIANLTWTQRMTGCEGIVP
ncbi:hypothetical protein GCM10009422_04510 [Brevundimonas kwangchunensis]|uniref:DUF4440 domain-containing protein n=1 Tax=Brevundimonas kwangchunensis TaxID=322163 RepID=A0ABN1GJ70_9CAUL